ncbi:hypothetical protein L596_002874 [Steinernema carpocapsae]|uniref:Uncharacterized protein n=1 Tax=Steinernema carpocapsae TaxID=34508 RepID=A0A4U8UUL6_STECR|nr:hypothetical protein L596_002874 [Steinernema carpocapsae]
MESEAFERCDEGQQGDAHRQHWRSQRMSGSPNKSTHKQCHFWISVDLEPDSWLGSDTTTAQHTSPPG